VRARLEKLFRQEFVGIDAFVRPLDLGPPVGRPVQYRLSGPDIEKVRELAQQLAGTISRNPSIGDVFFDWNEPGKVLKIKVAQDKARQYGISSDEIAQMLNNVTGGSAITQVRDGIYLVNVIGRARKAERTSVETFQNLQIPGKNGQSLPLTAIASIGYEQEQPLVWRRDRLPTVTVKAGVLGDVQPATVVNALKPALKDFIAKLPAGYGVATGGAVEESAKAEGPIQAAAPLMIFIILTVLMIQLQSFQKLLLVVSVAPLGLIGVVAALLVSGKPLGFVAYLGVLALIGIIIRNAVILLTQIDDLREEGYSPWDAVARAATHRMRPILLTAGAASLGMIPIAREVFWGPMAYAMIGGILCATLLTLLFFPALYIAWYGIEEPAETPAAQAGPVSAE
jgi:multidrug efflux pump subunit AcrB